LVPHEVGEIKITKIRRKCVKRFEEIRIRREKSGRAAEKVVTGGDSMFFARNPDTVRHSENQTKNM